MLLHSYTICFIIIINLFVSCLQLNLDEGEEGRVINGKWASIKKFPYTVDYTGCAGAIIGDKWILSAAHCYDPSLKRKVRVGSDKRGRGTAVEVLRGFPHPKFVAHDYWGVYDLLLLELKHALIFNDSVQSVSLPDENASFVNRTASIAAFGRTGTLSAKSKILLEANLTLVSDEECSKKMKHFDPRMMICGRPTSGTSDASNLCKGDSGASIVFNGTAVGVVSWGDDECPVFGYTSFAKVSAARTWIRNVTMI